MQRTSQTKPSRYVRSRCGRLVEVAIDVSRDILSKGDESSQRSTLCPRASVKVGLIYDVRKWKRQWTCEDGAALDIETGKRPQLGI